MRALVEGSSVSATARLADVSKVTVLKLIVDFGYAAYRFHDRNVRNVRVRRLQVDEIWSFIGAKAKNVSHKEADGWGDAWTWTAIDADSKLCVSYLVGGRDAGRRPCYARFREAHPWSRTDHLGRPSCILGGGRDAFDSGVDYAVFTGDLRCPVDEEIRRFSPARCIRADMKVVSGNPDPKHVSTCLTSARISRWHVYAPLHAPHKRIQQEGGKIIAVWLRCSMPITTGVGSIKRCASRQQSNLA